MLRTISALGVAACVVGFAGSASAQVTYGFQGSLYDGVANSGGCVVGECATYTTAQRATASITFSAPLAPNLTNADASPSVTAFNFNDGVRTTTGPGAIGSMFRVRVTTDAAGVLTNYSVVLERTPGPPYTVSTPADPNSRVSYVVINPTSSSAVTNSVCFGRGQGGSVGDASNYSAGNCNSFSIDVSSSVGSSSAPTLVTAPPAPATVPTLSEWAMILFGAMLAGGAALHIQRRRAFV